MALFLVTGGAGFIGSNIAEELIRRKQKVRILDNLSTGKKENLKTFIDKVEFIEGDIRSQQDLKKALKDVDYILHQAALRSVAESVDDPFLTNDINVNGTLNLLFEAKKAKVKRVVYASSSAVYGNAKQFPQKEDFDPKPISPYGVSKLAAEKYCCAFAETFGLQTVSLRYFNVFGPRQNPESKYSACIPAFLARMLQNKPPIVEWDGRQSRDFTYVSNVVDANLIAVRKPGIAGQVINIGSGHTVSILQILNLLNKILDKKLKPEYAPKRLGDVRKTYADTSKMKKLLGLMAKVQFEEGLKITAVRFKENLDQLISS